MISFELWLFNWMDDGCLIAFSDVVCFLWYFPLCNWGICLLNCSHHFCQSSMPSCISSCLFPSQSSHLPTSSLPACCLRSFCNSPPHSGVNRAQLLKVSSVWSFCSPSSLAAKEWELCLCVQSKQPLPLSLHSALPCSSGQRCLMAWAGGCHQVPSSLSLGWHRPCIPVSAAEGAPGAVCLESRTGSPCLLACGMSLGTAATCICSADSNGAFHWKCFIWKVLQSALATSFVWPGEKHANLHLSVSWCLLVGLGFLAEWYMSFCNVQSSMAITLRTRWLDFPQTLSRIIWTTSSTDFMLENVRPDFFFFKGIYRAKMQIKAKHIRLHLR